MIHPALFSVLEAAACTVGTTAFFALLPIFTPGEKPAVTELVLAAGLQFALIEISIQLNLPTAVLNLLDAALLALFAVRFQKLEWRLALFTVVFFGIGSGCWIFALQGIFVWAAGPSAVSWAPSASMWAVFGAFSLLSFFFTKHCIPNSTASRLPGLAAAAALIILVMLSEENPHGMDPDKVQMWLMLAAFLIPSTVVLSLRHLYDAQTELTRMQAREKDAMEREYTAIRHAYEVNAELFHDFHNHMGVLARLLDDGKAQEARQYLRELGAAAEENRHAFTGDAAADWLIGHSASICALKAIEFEADVCCPVHMSIRSADLCTVLGNLLDNAVNAAERVPAEQAPFVHLRIRSVHQMLMIRVRNSAPAEATDVSSREKRPEALHGWGLQSASRAAESYDGSVVTERSGDVFTATATLCWDPALLEYSSRT